MTISPRYIVLANLVLLAAIAYVSSSAVGTAIAARLTPLPQVVISPPPPPLQRDARKPDSYYALINTRDIFNSVKAVAEPTPGPPKKTELKVKLWGVAIHDDGRSSCIIEDLGNHQQQLYKIGDTVQGIATVARVEWDKVILNRDGQEEILELNPDLRKPANMVVPAAAVATPSGDEHIQMVAENQYKVDKSEVDSALENMNQLLTQVRAVPHFEGGKSTGFRLFAIRQDSLFDKIGLKNGDIIQNINGTDLTDPSGALALFTELRNQPSISVRVLRNKEVRTLSYSIQ